MSWDATNRTVAEQAQQSIMYAKRLIDSLVLTHYLNKQKKAELEAIQRRLDKCFDQLNKFYK